MVALNREVDEMDTEARAPAGKGAAQGAETAVRAEVPDLWPEPGGDVQGATTERPARPVRDILAASLRLAPCTAPLTAPTLQGKLLLPWIHGASLQRGLTSLRMCAHSS